LKVISGNKVESEKGGGNNGEAANASHSHRDLQGRDLEIGEVFLGEEVGEVVLVAGLAGRALEEQIILAALELLALRPRGLGEPLPRHGGLGGADGGGSGAHRRDAERGGGRGEESEEKGDELHLGAERGKDGWR